MANEAYFSVTGYIATQPTWGHTKGGFRTLNLRLAWTPRRFDREANNWVDGLSSFASVRCYRKLAEYAGRSLHKGDPVVVTGTLSVRDYDGKDGTRRTAVEITATTISHDLCRGVTMFTKVRESPEMTAEEYERSQQAQAAGEGGEAEGGDGQADPAASPSAEPLDTERLEAEALDSPALESTTDSEQLDGEVTGEDFDDLRETVGAADPVAATV
jgi:single-strand DNA-binding protein